MSVIYSEFICYFFKMDYFSFIFSNFFTYQILNSQLINFKIAGFKTMHVYQTRKSWCSYKKKKLLRWKYQRGESDIHSDSFVLFLSSVILHYGLIIIFLLHWILNCKFYQFWECITEFRRMYGNHQNFDVYPVNIFSQSWLGFIFYSLLN